MAKERGVFPQWRGLLGSVVVLCALFSVGVFLIKSANSGQPGSSASIAAKLAGFLGLSKADFGLVDAPVTPDALMTHYAEPAAPAGESWWDRWMKPSSPQIVPIPQPGAGGLTMRERRYMELGAVGGTVEVIDGNTLNIHGQKWLIKAVDAPERGQACYHPNQGAWRCGDQSTQALAERIRGRTVWCFPKGLDAQGTNVGYCLDDAGDDIGHWMVFNGWAAAYTKYGAEHVTAEASAKSRRLGIWSGSFEMPWVVRGESRR